MAMWTAKCIFKRASYIQVRERSEKKLRKEKKNIKN